MLWLYRFSLWSYQAVIFLLSPYHERARRFRQSRKRIFSELEATLSQNQQPIIWIHAASLGEFEQGRPVIERLFHEAPDYRILLTFFSPSGFEAVKECQFIHYKAYLPMDSPKNATHFLSLVQPRMALFIKYEFWYFYLTGLAKSGIPVFLVASVFRSNQLFFHSIGRFYRPALRAVTHFFLQDESSKKLLNRIHITQSTVTGDSRFDRLAKLVQSAERFERIQRFKGNLPMMILGSVWKSDFFLLRPLIYHFRGRLRFLVAPHNVSENEINMFLDVFKPLVRYSEYLKRDLSRETGHVMILDNVGMLAACYHYADMAYVGGAFRGWVHNVLEPAAFGVPTIIGEHPSNMELREVKELVEKGWLATAGSPENLKKKVEEWLSSSEKGELSNRLTTYVSERTGATEMILNRIMQEL